MTQQQRILQYMRDFGSISPMEAFRDLGITKLATRISEMTRSGQEVTRQMEISHNRNGDTVRYMRYRLPES